MKFAFCVYGHLTLLTAEELSACKTILDGFEVQIVESTLDFVHEGLFLDIESILDDLLACIGPHVRGIIDVINHQDWEMDRYTLQRSHLSRAKIALDNALDTAYATERKS